MSKTTRIRRTADQWRTLIAEHAGSAMTQEAFCKDKQLALSTFTTWKRRLSPGPGDQGESTPTEPTWIDLGNLGAGTPRWDIELDLGDGVCLRLRRG